MRREPSRSWAPSSSSARRSSRPATRTPLQLVTGTQATLAVVDRRDRWSARSSSSRLRFSFRGSRSRPCSGSRSSGSASRPRSIEGGSVVGSLRRGFDLGRADYVHAAGSLATLVILFFLAAVRASPCCSSRRPTTPCAPRSSSRTRSSRRSSSSAARSSTSTRSARLRSRAARKERDADVPDAHDADREGSPDAAREPGAAS